MVWIGGSRSRPHQYSRFHAEAARTRYGAGSTSGFRSKRRFRMQKKSAVAFVLAVVMAPALLLAAPGNGNGNGQPNPDQILRNPRLLARYLHLTPDQVTQEQQLFKTLGTALKGLRDQEKPLHDQLQALLAGSNPSACDVGALVVQIDGLRDQAR